MKYPYVRIPGVCSKLALKILASASLCVDFRRERRFWKDIRHVWRDDVTGEVCIDYRPPPAYSSRKKLEPDKTGAERLKNYAFMLKEILKKRRQAAVKKYGRDFDEDAFWDSKYEFKVFSMALLENGFIAGVLERLKLPVSNYVTYYVTFMNSLLKSVGTNSGYYRDAEDRMSIRNFQDSVCCYALSDEAETGRPRKLKMTDIYALAEEKMPVLLETVTTTNRHVRCLYHLMCGMSAEKAERVDGKQAVTDICGRLKSPLDTLAEKSAGVGRRAVFDKAVDCCHEIAKYVEEEEKRLQEEAERRVVKALDEYCVKMKALEDERE